MNKNPSLSIDPLQKSALLVNTLVQKIRPAALTAWARLQAPALVATLVGLLPPERGAQLVRGLGSSKAALILEALAHLSPLTPDALVLLIEELADLAAGQRDSGHRRLRTRP